MFSTHLLLQDCPDSAIFFFSIVHGGDKFSSWPWCSVGGPCVEDYNGVSCIKTKSSSANCPLCPQYQTHLVCDTALFALKGYTRPGK